MATHTLYPLKIITPDAVLFDGEVQLTIVTGTAGQIGFYAHHTPLVAHLRMGFVRVQTADDSWLEFVSSYGFAQVNGEDGLVLLNQGVPSDAVDAEKARELIERGERDLKLFQEGDVADERGHHPQEHMAQLRIDWGNHLLLAAEKGVDVAASPQT